jgi:hypothetical protein
MPVRSIYENSHIAYINETGEPSIEVAPACGGVEVGGITIFPVPRSSEDWPGLERNGQGAAIPDMRFGGHIHVPTQREKLIYTISQPGTGRRHCTGERVSSAVEAEVKDNPYQ